MHMHRRKTAVAVTDTDTETFCDRNKDNQSQRRSNNNNNKRTLERIPVFVRALLLSAIVSGVIFWFRLHYDMMGNKTNPHNFRLESEEAPKCRAIESPSHIDTTLVTQLSDDRLWMMKHHCERYGPHLVSIAVYSKSPIEDVVSTLVTLGCQVIAVDDEEIYLHDRTSSGKHALVSVRVLDANTHGSENDYPVNALRNLALKSVTTTHITYIDVDFWTSDGLYDTLLSPPIQQCLFDDPKLALVIPAFQLERDSRCRHETEDCPEINVPRMPRTIDDLVAGTRASPKAIRPFDTYNPSGHGSTDYEYWFDQQMHSQLALLGDGLITAEPESAKNDRHNNHRRNINANLYDIPCLKSHRYEPYVTIRYCRELTPPFQSVFSGFGKNKMTWMLQVVASGFVFAQVGGAYLVHYPHAISKSRQHWNEAPPELQLVAERSSSSGGSNSNSNSKVVATATKTDTYKVRRPQKSDGDPGFQNFHRGTIDNLYVLFKEWLADSISSQEARLTMCEDFQDDDNNLWIDPSRKTWKVR